MKRVLIIGVLTLLVALTVWRFTCPALIRIRTDSLEGTAHLLVLNPIRSSAANSVTLSFLELLQSGKAAEVSRRFPLIGNKVVEDSILPPINSWVLDDVVADTNGGIDFEYLYSQGASTEKGGYIWIYCIKGTNGEWTVKTFNRVY